LALYIFWRSPPEKIKETPPAIIRNIPMGRAIQKREFKTVFNNSLKREEERGFVILSPEASTTNPKLKSKKRAKPVKEILIN